LRQVLGLDFVAQRTEDKIHHGLLVFFDQFRKCRTVAALGAEHQRGIRIGLDWHRAPSVTNPAGAERNWIIGLLDYWIIGLLDYWIDGFMDEGMGDFFQ
jgi:hypothetical protein